MQQPAMILGEVRTLSAWRWRSWRVGAAVALVAAAVLVTILVRGARASGWPRPPARAVVPLDVPQYRALVEARRRGAQELASAVRTPADHSRRDGLTRGLIEPHCALGPTELCTQFGVALDACRGPRGDVRTCVAIARYVESTTMSMMAAIFYYHRACSLGDAESCDRVGALNGIDPDAELDCDIDRVACTFRARRARDAVALDRLCTRGVSDACAVLTRQYADRPATMHAFLVAGCQVGGLKACDELARRLAPECRGDDCFAPDPAQAAIAATFACEAGFTERCDPLSR